MGLSIPHLLVVLAIVALVFGTKRLKNVGSDIGEAIKGFRKAMNDGENEGNAEVGDKSQVLEGEVSRKDRDQV